MTLLTQREAARVWSIPWTTFRRKVQSGELSIGADKRVDPAEMVRVFGEPRPSTTDPNGPSKTIDPFEFYRHNEQLLKAQKDMLQAENDGLRAVIAAKDETIRTQADALLRLTAPKADATPPASADPTGRRVLIALAVFTALVIAAVAFDLPSLIAR